ncbi:hypothetical protein ABIA39_008601 [Nocardia sp. GAS34]|uniref:hypothetical protein n=1 Tax=unclassified Nocardia TaxID=2637762 RepID=UPI003D20EBF2
MTITSPLLRVLTRGRRAPDAGQRTTQLARKVRPDLRLPWTMIEPSRTQRAFATGSVGWFSPTHQWADRVSAVVIDHAPELEAAEFLDRLIDEFATAAGEDLDLCPAVGIAMLLALWDSEFRASGLYGGNIYLASAGSVAALGDVAGWSAPLLVDAGVLERVLLSMASAELLYQFPVAAKFRGEFGPDRQLRLNCWGRQLAERVIRGGAATTRITAARERIRHHLENYDGQYRRHMEVLAHLEDYQPGHAWACARSLPVGVLV